MSKLLKLTAGFFLGCLLTLSLYVNSNFQWRNNYIESVEVFIGEADSIVPPTMYLFDANAIDFAFDKGYKSTSLNEISIRFNLSTTNQLRKIRLDVQKVGRDIFVNDIVFVSLVINA